MQSLLLYFSNNSSYHLLKLRFEKEPLAPAKRRNKDAGVGACPEDQSLDGLKALINTYEQSWSDLEVKAKALKWHNKTTKNSQGNYEEQGQISRFFQLFWVLC